MESETAAHWINLHHRDFYPTSNFKQHCSAIAYIAIVYMLHISQQYSLFSAH